MHLIILIILDLQLRYGSFHNIKYRIPGVLAPHCTMVGYEALRIHPALDTSKLIWTISRMLCFREKKCHLISNTLINISLYSHYITCNTMLSALSYHFIGEKTVNHNVYQNFIFFISYFNMLRYIPAT